MAFQQSSRSYVMPGVDWAGLTTITPSVLQNGLELASPAADVGFCIVSETTPDVGVNPELVNFLWIRPSTGILSFYYVSSWIPIKSLANIPAQTLTLDMVDASGQTANAIVRVDASATTLEAVPFSSLFVDGGLDVVKLKPSGADYTVAVTLSGVVQWIQYNTLFNAQLAGSTIPISNIAKGAAGANPTYLTTNAAGTTISWTSIDIPGALTVGSVAVNRLAPGTDGYVIRTTSGAAVWSADKALPSFISPNTVIPAAGSLATIPHGMSSIPRNVQAFLVCDVTDSAIGCTAGDMVPIHDVLIETGQLGLPMKVDATNILIGHIYYTGGYLYVLKWNGSGSNLTYPIGSHAITTTDWHIKVYAWE